MALTDVLQNLPPLPEDDVPICFMPPAELGPPDLVLISADGDRFGVHKMHLAVNSLLFASLFQDATDKDATITLHDVDRERTEVLNLVLPFCYNIPSPNVEGSLDFLCDAFDLANKYGIQRAIQDIGEALANYFRLSSSSSDSLKIYALGCKFTNLRMRESAKVAAATHSPFVKDPTSFLSELGTAGVKELWDICKSNNSHQLSVLQSRLSEQETECHMLKRDYKELRDAAKAFMNRVPSDVSAAGLQKKRIRLENLCS